MLLNIFLILGSGYFAVQLVSALADWRTVKGFLINILALAALLLALLVGLGVVRVAG